MNRQILGNEDINKEIKKIIEEHYYFKERNNDTYIYEICLDYNNQLEISLIKKIFDSNNPKDEFYAIINEWFFECESYYQSEMINTIEKYFYEDVNEVYFENFDDIVINWVQEYISFKYPVGHFLKQEVCVDIIVDTGDGNYDFTCNELFGCIHRDKGIQESSSLVWLMRQQGYTEEKISDFVENENMCGSKLLESIYNECLNTTSCLNALSFFVKMTLEECLNLYEEKKKKEKNIVINKSTPCGLYDSWSGAGSVLEIELENDVVIPLKYVDSTLPDGCRGYGINSIYGLDSSFWKDKSVIN